MEQRIHHVLVSILGKKKMCKGMQMCGPCAHKKMRKRSYGIKKKYGYKGKYASKK